MIIRWFWGGGKWVVADIVINHQIAAPPRWIALVTGLFGVGVLYCWFEFVGDYPPVHILATVDIGFSTGVVARCALFWGVPAAVVCYLSSYGRHSPTRFRWNEMSGRRNPALAIQLCLCRKLRISSFYNLQHQMPDRCVLTALDFSMPMLWFLV